MELKQFFKISVLKGIIFLLLILSAYLIHNNQNPFNQQLSTRSDTISKVTSNLYPLNYVFGGFYTCGNVPFLESCYDLKGKDVNTLNFTFMLMGFGIFYYLNSCLIVWIIGRIKPEK